jgi:interferon-induced transmembrane protein/zinc ribbon protein
MFCIHCGAANPDGSKTCSACGRPLVPAGAVAGTAPPQLPGQPIPNYLVFAIITTLCFGCLPFGVVAIVYAAQVNGKVAAGDLAGAMQASKSAKMWCWISFGSWLALLGVYLIMGIFGAVQGQRN